MYPVEMLLGLMFLFWAAAVWATYKENPPSFEVLEDLTVGGRSVGGK